MHDVIVIAIRSIYFKVFSNLCTIKHLLSRKKCTKWTQNSNKSSWNKINPLKIINLNKFFGKQGKILTNISWFTNSKNAFAYLLTFEFRRINGSKLNNTFAEDKIIFFLMKSFKIAWIHWIAELKNQKFLNTNIVYTQ